MDIPTILIVDDEPDQRDNLKSLIEPRINCKICEASNGSDALDYLKDNICDLVILDIKMPKKSGIDVLDKLSELEIPAIVLTGWDSEQVYKECKRRHAIEYVPKGESLTIVRDKVTAELKKQGKFYPKT